MLGIMTKYVVSHLKNRVSQRRSKMSFNWKCVNCGCKIIVPYESPKIMSRYSAPMCPDCFNDSLKKEKSNVISRLYVEEYRQEDGNPIYKTPEGMAFFCQKA